MIARSNAAKDKKKTSSSSSNVVEIKSLEQVEYEEKYRNQDNNTHSIAKKLCRIAHFMHHRVVLSEPFNQFVILYIMLAGINVGIQTYAYSPSTPCESQSDTNSAKIGIWIGRPE